MADDTTEGPSLDLTEAAASASRTSDATGPTMPTVDDKSATDSLQETGLTGLLKQRARDAETASSKITKPSTVQQAGQDATTSTAGPGSKPGVPTVIHTAFWAEGALSASQVPRRHLFARVTWDPSRAPPSEASLRWADTLDLDYLAIGARHMPSTNYPYRASMNYTDPPSYVEYTEKWAKTTHKESKAMGEKQYQAFLKDKGLTTADVKYEYVDPDEYASRHPAPIIEHSQFNWETKDFAYDKSKHWAQLRDLYGTEEARSKSRVFASLVPVRSARIPKDGSRYVPPEFKIVTRVIDCMPGGEANPESVKRATEFAELVDSLPVSAAPENDSELDVQGTDPVTHAWDLTSKGYSTAHSAMAERANEAYSKRADKDAFTFEAVDPYQFELIEPPVHLHMLEEPQIKEWLETYGGKGDDDPQATGAITPYVPPPATDDSVKPAGLGKPEE